jgi:hypothetical protein
MGMRSWWARARTPSAEELAILRAISSGRVGRDALLAAYEPHYLDGRDVSWKVRSLQLKGLVVIRPVGPPELSRRGYKTLGNPETETFENTLGSTRAEPDRRRRTCPLSGETTVVELIGSAHRCPEHGLPGRC